MKITFKLPTGHDFQNFRHAVSNDVLRPVLHGLIVNFKTKKAYITNAHVLVRYPIESETESEEVISVPLSIFDTTKYQFINFKDFKIGIDQVDFVYDTEEKTVTAKIDLTKEDLYKVMVIEGTPPNAEAVIPKMDELETNNSMNIDLNKFVQIQKAVKLKRMSVIESTIFTNSPNRASVITFNNDQLKEIKAIVMPWQKI